VTAKVWLLAVTLPLAAQPKLLINAQVDTRSAAAGLNAVFRALVTTQAQPAWIGYTVPSVRTFNLGCDYVRDSISSHGVIHLEPPDHAVILFRTESNSVTRIRAISPDCEIDAGGAPVHWLTDVAPSQSVEMLASYVQDFSRGGDGSVFAIAVHADPAAGRALERLIAPDQPQQIRLRSVSFLGSVRGPEGLRTLQQLIANDPDTQVRQRAVSALVSVPAGAGIPVLIQLAKTTQDSEIRKQAMNSLQQSRDPRAVSFFEEVLNHR
jgi:HEAT repeat protein